MLLKRKELLKDKGFINGEWVTGNQSTTFEVIDPANNEVITKVADLSLEDANRSIEAAHGAWLSWRKTSNQQRAQLLRQWYDLITLHAEDLARILTMEQGKPIREARAEIAYGASFIEWFAEEAKRIYGDVVPKAPDGRRILVLKQPVGVVSAITPWNFPIAMITRKCAPALAAGCTMVIKPASKTPLSALALAALAEEAGIPNGVLNVIPTTKAFEIGKLLATHESVRKISFTGSTNVGKQLLEYAADTIKRVSLELGGNGPLIVFNDANTEEAVNGTIAAKFRNSGQTCICPNRILVQSYIFDVFAEKLAHHVKLLKVGPGMAEDTDQGPLINEAAIKKVEHHIDDAVSKGATILTGGKRHSLGGTYFEPTILINANSKMLLAHEETFGPIAPLFRFDTIEEAIKLANDTPYGLAAYFYSQDIHTVMNVAEQLESGVICVNTGRFGLETAPFGGYKQSGIGREGSKYGINEYLELKSIILE